MEVRNKLAKKFNLYTIGAVYFLILVGGIVRSMGAGMGCPDWPRCFGSYIPPTSSDDLPSNYQELFAKSRVAKNERLARTLDGLGFGELADQVTSDPDIHHSESFDAGKAWVEYINRLIGVLIGFLIILNMVFSFAYRHQNKWVPVLGIFGLVLVIFQGWVGSLVVSTNLLPGFITFHMILALLLVALLLFQQYLMTDKSVQVTGRLPILLLLTFFVAQIVLGTQVREQVDALQSSGVFRDQWVDRLGVLFLTHRSFSLGIVAVTGWLVIINRKNGPFSGALKALIGIIVLEILFGIVLAYFSMPAFAQPAHLFLGTLAFGVIFYLFLSTNFQRNNSNVHT